MPITGERSPPKIRKKWGNKGENSGFQSIGEAGKPTKAVHKNFKEDEDDYSDSFEDIQ